MFRQTMLVFFVFLIFVFMGAGIFFVTKNVEWFYPLEDPHLLKTDWRGTWSITKAPDNSFSIRTPTFAQHSVDNVLVPAEPGQTIRHDLYTSFGYDHTRYIVGVIQLPLDFDVSDPKSIMDSDMESLLEGYPREALLDYKTIDIGGHPGIAFTMERGDTMVSARFILVDHTMYQLLVQSVNGMSLPQEELEYFMASFRVGSEVEQDDDE